MANIIQLQSPYLPGQSPYEIFQNRMQAVAGIANGIQRIRENKWESDLIQAIVSDIARYNSEDEIEQSNTLLNQEYVEPQKVEIEEFAQNVIDMVGRTPANIITQKEQMMGNLPKQIPVEGSDIINQAIASQEGGMPQPSITSGNIPEQVSNPVALPKGTFEQIFGMVKQMGGAINFDTVLKMMEQRKRTIPVSPLEQNVLQYLMNQPSPKTQLASDIQLAQAIENALYPERAQQRELDMYKAKLTAQKEIEEAFAKETNVFNTEELREKINSMNDMLAERGFIPTNIQAHSNGTISFNVKPIQEDSTGIAWEDVLNLGKQAGLEISGINYNPQTGAITISQARPYKETTSTTKAGSSLSATELNNLKTITDLETLESELNTLEANGRNVSRLRTPEGITDLYLPQIKLAQTAIEEQYNLLRQDLTDAERKKVMVAIDSYKNYYNKIREIINAQGIVEIPPLSEQGSAVKIEEIPTRGYDIRIGKWKGQVNSEKLADIILEQTNDWAEITKWLNSQELTNEEINDIIKALHKKM